MSPSNPSHKQTFSTPQKEGGMADANKAIRQRQEQTEKLTQQRLEKDAEELAAAGDKPKKKPRKAAPKRNIRKY